MRVVIAKKYLWAEKYIRNIPMTFEREGQLIYDGRNKVKRIVIDGKTFIIKKFKRPNIIQTLGYSTFRQSKAERAYRFAFRFLEAGINTPGAIAFIEQRCYGLLRDSYFVSEECDWQPVTDYLRREDFDKEMADSVAQLFVKIHENGILHGDLNMTNILFRKNGDGSYEFSLIDTNRSKFIAEPSMAECAKNLMRFSHLRPVLEYVCAKYAEQKGLNKIEFVGKVIANLDKFEQRKARKKALLRR